MTDKKNKKMKKCKLLDVEMPLNMICPSDKRFVCYKDCGFSPLRDVNKKINIKIKKEIQTTI